MPGFSKHVEKHHSGRIGWLRASVLGANDGILSVASIVVGVAAAQSEHRAVLLAGVAGLTAGAMSMAAGEYVSVSSQADTEAADRQRESQELTECPDAELEELTRIYVERGLERGLAEEVAVSLTKHDALKTHLRDELGITEELAARPLQAALASAISFATGAIVPLLLSVAVPRSYVIMSVFTGTLFGLALLGALSAVAGGAPIVTGTVRVTFWGVVAMATTSAIGWLFGVAA